MISRLGLGCVLAAGLAAQAPVARVTQAIQDQVTVRLAGNTLALASPARDRGAAAPGMPLEHMLLVLKHSDRQEMDLRLLLDQQRTTGASGYHRWLTPAQFGERFGPALSDIAAVTQWLTGEGFTVNRVAAGRGVIEFSGTAGNLGSAFHTQLHRYQATDGLHWANAQDPAIPAALAPVVAGIVSLNDVRARPAAHIVGHHSLQPALNFSDGTHAIAPGDFAAIYDTQPLLDAKNDGTGETIAVVARSDISPSDYQQFRTTFLPSGTGPGLKTVEADTDPGVASNGDEVEATLDAEWATGAAPGAQVALVASGGSTTTDGVDLAALYIVDHDLAPVMNTSFGNCEADLGAAENQFWFNLYEQAAAEGISAFTSAGDNGAAGCDDPSTATAVHGAAVSGLASTPFNTAVGGTEFNEGGTPATYWGGPRQDYSSALGYIPETAWNESAASGNNPASLFAGSGGVSTIYAKPAWQAGTGVPADSKRDLPDVSLNAAGGHDGYVLCLTKVVQGQTVSCSGGEVFVVGGTSASSPAFAGLTALVDQKMGGRQGLVNPVLYQLFAKKPAAFHDTTVGNTDVPGQTGFAAAAGYDMATGLGSVDASALVNAWNSVSFAATTTALTLTLPANLVHGQSVPMSLQVAGTGQGGALPTGAVELLAQKSDGSQTALETFALANGQVAATSIAALPGGSYTVVARYSGDLNFASSVSAAIPVVVQPEPSTVTLNLLDFISGKPVSTTTVTYGDPLTVLATVAGTSGIGSPSGRVDFGPNYFNWAPVGAGGIAQLGPNFYFFFAGPRSLTAAYSGDASFLASTATPLSLTIKPGPTFVSLAASGSGNSLNLVATVTTQALAGQAPGGHVSFFDNGTLFLSQFTEPQWPDPKTGTQLSTATVTQPKLDGAQANITAQYTGDESYAASAVSNSVAITTPADIELTPAHLDFGIVGIGAASAPQTVIATNHGGTQSWGSVAIQAPYAETDTCGAAGLAPGASCSIQVVFQPTSSGTWNADMGYGNSLFTSLSGSASGIFLFSNQGSQTISAGQSAQFPVSIEPQFGFTGPVTLSCSGLPPLSTCSFAPSSVSLDGKTTAAALVTITTTAPPISSQLPPWGDWGAGLGLGLLGLCALARIRGPRRVQGWAPVGIALVAMATLACGGGGGGATTVTPPPNTPPVASPAVTLSPTSVSFPTVPVGQTSPAQTVKLTNTGAAPLLYSGLSFLEPGGDAQAFAATTTCPGTIAVQSSCTFSLVMTPTTGGTKAGTLLIRDNAANSPQAVALTGNAVSSTPSGWYSIEITATSGRATSSTNLLLQVQ